MIIIKKGRPSCTTACPSYDISIAPRLNTTPDIVNTRSRLLQRTGAIVFQDCITVKQLFGRDGQYAFERATERQQESSTEFCRKKRLTPKSHTVTFQSIEKWLAERSLQNDYLRR